MEHWNGADHHIFWLHTLRTTRDGSQAGPHDLDQAERLHQRYKAVDLGWLAGDLEDKALNGGIHDLGPESIRKTKRFGPVIT